MEGTIGSQKSLKSKGTNKLIEFLRSEIFVLFAFLALTLPFMWHTADLLLRVSAIQNTLYAWFFAFGFDLAIFTFAINGRKAEATGLAFGVFVLNICFFNLDTLYVMFSAESVAQQLLVRLVVTVIISGMGSYIVHSYVVFFNDKIGNQDRIMSFHEKVYQQEKEIDSLKKKLEESTAIQDRYDELKLQFDLSQLKLNLIQDEIKQPIAINQAIEHTPAEQVKISPVEVNPGLLVVEPDEPIFLNSIKSPEESGEAIGFISLESGKFACSVHGCKNTGSKEQLGTLRKFCINTSCPKTEIKPSQIKVAKN